MFREALGYPTRSPGGGRSVIVGGLVLLVTAGFVAALALDPPLAYLAAGGLLPWLLVRGYYVRVVRTTIGRDRPTPPRFEDVPRLLRDGLTAVGIAVAYLLPGAVVLGPLIAVRALGTDLSAALLDRAVPAAATTAVVSVAGVAAVLALMYAIGALYVLPVAVARFAHTDEPRMAFEPRTVVSGAFTEDYATAWGVSFALQLFLLPVAYLLRVLVVGFFLQFIVVVGVRYCYGQGVGAALGLDAVPAAHERSDPDDWALRAAVTPAEPGTNTARHVRDPASAPASGAEHDGAGPAPAFVRVDDGSEPKVATGGSEDEPSGDPVDEPSDDADDGSPDDDAVGPSDDTADGPETFGGGFRPAVTPDDDEGSG